MFRILSKGVCTKSGVWAFGASGWNDFLSVGVYDKRLKSVGNLIESWQKTVLTLKLIYLFIYLSDYLSIYLSMIFCDIYIYIYIYLYFYLYLLISTCLSIYLFIFLYTHTYIYIYTIHMLYIL